MRKKGKKDRLKPGMIFSSKTPCNAVQVCGLCKHETLRPHIGLGSGKKYGSMVGYGV